MTSDKARADHPRIDHATQTVSLPIDIRVGPGPDGNPWVLFTISDTFITASFRIPPVAADQLAASIAGALTKAAVQARREASGLILTDTIPDTLSQR